MKGTENGTKIYLHKEDMFYIGKIPYNCLRSQCDNIIIKIICNQLTPDQIFVDTGWLDIDYLKKLDLTATKTAVCYSGIDWENTNCIDARLGAHRYIRDHSGNQLHIGNSSGVFYFNWWAEFIRQYPDYFFHESYITDINCESLFMCLNRKPHQHRVKLLELIEQAQLGPFGIISSITRPLTDNLLFVDQQDPESRQSVNDILTLGDPELWNKHFVNVVTETTIHTDVFLSEKTWKPIIGLRPFLILGDYNIYFKLQELGFDTFDDIFGKWYLDTDWECRATVIVDILTKFEKDPVMLDSLWHKLKPRLQHNRQRFVEFQIENFQKICNLGL